MKSMEYYINSEQELNTNLIENHALLDIVNDIDISKYNEIIIFATGSSKNASEGARILMQRVLNIPVYVKEPTIAADYDDIWRESTLYFAISQGGHSQSIINLVEKMQSKNVSVYVITSDMESPLAKVANSTVDLGIGIEEMPYVTAGYTATILILWLISIRIANQSKLVDSTQVDEYYNKIKEAINRSESVIQKTQDWYETHKQDLINKKRYVFISYGAGYGVVLEAAMKFMEILHLPAHGNELEEYMHGPYLAVNRTDALFLVDVNGKNSERLALLREFLDIHMDRTYLFSLDEPKKYEEQDLLFNVQVDELLAPLLLTIPFHIISYNLSLEHGIDLTQSYYPEFDQITQSKV